MPSVAPVEDPLLEAIFNITVSYAVLLVGFAGDWPGHSDSQQSTTNENVSHESNDDMDQKFSPDSTLFILLCLFLTNICWLPYLILRQGPNPTTSSKSNAPVSKCPKLLLRISQSPWLPIYACTIFLISIGFAIYGRPSIDLPAGDITSRVQDFQRLWRMDILFDSFIVDCAAFFCFQSWLVNDDQSQRGWKGSSANRAKQAARFIPFFGLAWYLIERSRAGSSVQLTRD